MKKRDYTITSGWYEDYRIIAQIEGPESPALSTLWKQFKKEYGLEDAQQGMSVTMALNDALHRRAAAFKRLRAEGYDGTDMPEIFLQWLYTNHGFQEIKSNVFHVDR